MKKERPKTRKVKAIALVGVESKQIYLNESLVKYQVFYDGFIADNVQAEHRGRGQKTKLVECTISYKA